MWQGDTWSFDHENDTIRFVFKRLILSAEGKTDKSTERLENLQGYSDSSQGKKMGSEMKER